MNADAQPSTTLIVPGRRSESELLVRLLGELQSGRGGAVLISGEAGIGKTALVEAMSINAASAGVTVLAAATYDMEVPPPYGLWQELFMNARRNGTLANPPAELMHGDASEAAAGVRELWDRTARAILDVAGNDPVLLILEDLHWADQSSIELLRYLARLARQAPILIAVTYRDVDLTPAYPLYHLLPQLVRETRPERIPLWPLGPDSIRTLLVARYPTLARDDRDRLTDYLEDYAEGNPLFVEELLGLLEETHVLSRDGHVWALEDLPAFAVPPLIRQIIEGRVEHLTPQARTALDIAAVIGTDVRLEIWQSICSLEGLEAPEALEDVLRSRALQETADIDTVRFRHALVRDAIYSNTNPLQRRQWHARIGQMLAGIHDIDPGIVAHHFLQANDDRAAEWLIEVAQRAGRAFAMQAAVDGYERALGILDHLPNRTGQRIEVLCALAEANRFTNTARALVFIQQAADLLQHEADPAIGILARWVQARVRGFDDEPALQELIAAGASFEQLPVAEQQRIIGSPLGYVVSRATLAQDLAIYGMFSAAIDHGEQFIATHLRPASRAQYIEFGNAHFGIGIASAALGDPARARAAFKASRQFFREAGNFQMVSNAYYWELGSVMRLYYPDQPQERHRLQLEEVRSNLHSEFVEAETGERQDSTSETLILDGDWDESWRSASLRQGIPASRVPSARKLAEIEWLRGNLERSREHIRSIMPAGPEEPPGRRFFLHRLDLQRIAADVALDSRDIGLAEYWIGAFERWIDWSGRAIGQPEALLLRARLHLGRGKGDEALAAANLAIDGAADPPQPLIRLKGLRLAGEIHLRAGKTDAARNHLERSLAIAEACAAPYEIAHTSICLASTLLQTGDEDRARMLLERAGTIARNLGAQPLIERIKAVGQPESRAAPVAEATPLGLTPRQLEVLRLLARGMTDAEIADELFISPRTVHGHLNAIYGKLGVDTRTAAVARAYAGGVVLS